LPNAFKVCHSAVFVKSSDGAVEKQCSEDCLNSKNQTHMKDANSNIMIEQYIG